MYISVGHLKISWIVTGPYVSCYSAVGFWFCKMKFYVLKKCDLYIGVECVLLVCHLILKYFGMTDHNLTFISAFSIVTLRPSWDRQTDSSVQSSKIILQPGVDWLTKIHDYKLNSLQFRSDTLYNAFSMRLRCGKAKSLHHMLSFYQEVSKMIVWIILPPFQLGQPVITLLAASRCDSGVDSN